MNKFTSYFHNEEIMTVLRVSFNAPLNEYNTENQTFGCRQNNSDI